VPKISAGNLRLAESTQSHYLCTMPYLLHSQLTTPPDETVLWKYLNFSKFIDLLERQVFWFARTKTFEDPLEGTVTDAELAHLRSLDIQKPYLDNLETMRNTTFVNCWRGAPSESMAMWDIYGKGPGTIAIKSSVGLLKKSFESYAGNVFITEVQYIDWSTAPWDNNTLVLCARKDSSYHYEAEVRAIIWDLANIGIVPANVQITRDDDGSPTYIGPNGIELSCNPADVITEVIVGPKEQPMIERLVKLVLKRYSLTLPVTASDRLKSRL
jgi:hypothetical protein